MPPINMFHSQVCLESTKVTSSVIARFKCEGVGKGVHVFVI